MKNVEWVWVLAGMDGIGDVVFQIPKDTASDLANSIRRFIEYRRLCVLRYVKSKGDNGVSAAPSKWNAVALGFTSDEGKLNTDKIIFLHQPSCEIMEKMHEIWRDTERGMDEPMVVPAEGGTQILDLIKQKCEEVAMKRASMPESNIVQGIFGS